MFHLKIVLIFCGCVFAYLAWEEKHLAQSAKSTPQTITCADLATRGPGDNAYVRLTDYELASNFVYESDRRAGAGWTLVYIPVLPRRTQNNEPDNTDSVHPKIIIKSNSVQSERDLSRIAGQIEGMVISDVRSLSPHQKQLLSQSYPGTNWDACWVVEHGHRPASMGKVFGLLGVAIAFAGTGIGLFFVRRRKAVAPQPTTQPVGIVPGFPPNLPRRLQEAWLILVSHPQEVSLAFPEPDSMRITLHKNPRSVWKIVAVCMVLGIAGLIGTWCFDRYQRSDSFDVPVRYDLIRLYLASGMCIGAGVLVALINIASGGIARETVIDVCPNRLKLDYHISGDHIVRQYSPEEVIAIAADPAIEIELRSGVATLALFASTVVQGAVAEIVGTILWGQDVIIACSPRNAADARRGGRVVVHRAASANASPAS